MPLVMSAAACRGQTRQLQSQATSARSNGLVPRMESSTISRAREFPGGPGVLAALDAPADQWRHHCRPLPPAARHFRATESVHRRRRCPTARHVRPRFQPALPADRSRDRWPLSAVPSQDRCLNASWRRCGPDACGCGPPQPRRRRPYRRGRCPTSASILPARTTTASGRPRAPLAARSHRTRPGAGRGPRIRAGHVRLIQAEVSASCKESPSRTHISELAPQPVITRIVRRRLQKHPPRRGFTRSAAKPAPRPPS